MFRRTKSDLHTFWAEKFNDRGRSFADPRVIVVAADSSTTTACGQLGGFTITASYFPADETVYVDTDHWLRETSAEWGDAAIGTVVLAHEWTHHAQHLLGSLPQSSSEAAEAELEADCGSGAFLAWTQDQPDPLVTEQGLEAIWAFVETIALPVPGQLTPERLTPERLTMLRTGFRDGIDACGIFPPSPTAGDIGGGGPPAKTTANPTIMPTLTPTATSAPIPAVVATTTLTPAAAPPNDAPRTPTGVSARFSQGNAVVTWNAAEEDERISRYEIYRNDERIGTVRLPATISTLMSCPAKEGSNTASWQSMKQAIARH